MKRRSCFVDIRFLLDIQSLYGLVLICYSPVFTNGFLDSWNGPCMVMNVFTESDFRVENLIAVFAQS